MTAGSNRLERVAQKVPRVTAAIAIIAGLFCLACWVTGANALIGFVAPMVANTAVMSVLGGVGLWLLASRTVTRRARLVVKSCAVTICVIAAAALLGHATESEREIPWLFSHLDQPALQTAFAFLALGTALLAIDRPLRWHATDFLALAAMGIAITALVGHALELPALYAVPRPHIGMSVPTAVVVFGLGLGLLAARGERSIVAVVLARDAGGVAARRLLAGLIALPPVALVLYVGARAGWYSVPVASAVVLLFAIAEASGLIISTANRLSRADAALRTTEGRVRALVEQASDAILVAGLDGRLTEINDTACRILGYPRAELVGEPIAKLLDAADLPRLAAAREQLLAGKTQLAEWTLRRRDGTPIPVEVNAKILADGRWQGIVRDITERKQAEAALSRAAVTERALRAELEALIGAVSSTVGVLPESDVDGVLRAIAEQARTLTGAKHAAAAIGSAPGQPFDHWGAAGIPDQVAAAIGRRPNVVGVLAHAATSGDAIRIPDVARHPAFRGLPEHHPAISSFLAVPIKRGDRAIGTLYLANKQDASEFSADDERVVIALANRVAAAIETAVLYAAEAELRGWFQAVINQLPEGVIVLDAVGKVTAMNRAIRRLAAPDSLGRDQWGNPAVFDIRDLERRPVPFDDLPIVHALRTGEETRDREFLLRQSDGRMVPVAASAGPVRDDAGRITGAVVIVTDISERKELARMREEWIAVVAHDLRQPINTILLWSERILSLTRDDKLRAAVERIRGAGWRLNRMIEDLLDAARITAHRLHIEPRTTDVLEVVRATVDTARLANPSVELVVRGSSRELAWIDGDRIHQVLNNLLSNAVKYGAPHTPIEVVVSGRDSEIEVAVVNQGQAIAGEELSQLFARFGRTQRARSERIPGIGLGLYICKGLVEAHGGRIWAESDHGTTAFRFTVPRPPE